MEEEEGSIWKPEDGTSSPSSVPLGRVMSTLLGSRPRHLEAAVSRVAAAGVLSRSTSRALLDDSLCFLLKHVKDAVRRGEPLDQVLVPMIEHSLKFKGPKHSRQVSILLNWLFEDDLFQALLSSLAAIIMAKEDHYIAFGWCALVSNLVESTLNEFSDKGKHERHFNLLKTLCLSVPHLLSIIYNGSILQVEYELPTRLSVAAADFTLFLTEALTEAPKLSKIMPSSTPKSQLVELTPTSNTINQKHVHGSANMEIQHLLWDLLDLLISLVQKLHAWSRKSRPLHSKGLVRALKWMQEIRRHYNYQQDKPGGKLLMDGVLLLHSCWKHYAMLMRLEDHRFSERYGEMLEHYLSAIQLYKNEKDDGKKISNVETKKFFLNCLSLLMGRLDGKQLEIAITEHGSLLLNTLFSQLQHGDEDLVEVSLDLLRAIIFMENVFPGTSSNTNQMDAVLPILLSFLDKRDPTAKAIVPLIAEYCTVYPNEQGLQEILKRLKIGDQYQKKNGIDVISELTRICPDTEFSCILSSSSRQDIFMHLIECFEDEELIYHILESNLLSHFDPHSVFPALVRVLYSGNEKLGVSASDAIIDMLRCHNQNFSVVLTLIDCLSGSSDADNKARGIGETGGQKLDVDRVLRLIPKWSENVEHWSLLIEQSVNKMFQEPSNAIIVRFMSYISEQLAEARDLVLQRVLLHMQSQHQIEEQWLYDCRNSSSNAFGNFKDSLFDRLCPLLLLRVLPLRIFDDIYSSKLYGGLSDILAANADEYIDSDDCVAALLFKRAFGMFEFEDVRKLAAELCGRLHPEVLLPVIECQLKLATLGPDILKMKTCLFAICTSLVAREVESVSHPIMSRIRKILEMILSWSSFDANEVSKAQHGCIDCLALMICAELKAPDSSKDFDGNRGETASTSSTLAYVMQRLTHDESWDILGRSDRDACYSHISSEDPSYNASPSVGEVTSDGPMSIPFRLCMANVLISACQKVSSSRTDLLGCRLFPTVIRSVEAITCSDVRAACLQILFSAVYHLKSSVLPFSQDLLRLSTKALRKGTEKEKLAAAKLMASLMASEDEIIGKITGGLLEAKSVLVEVASKQSSPELQQLTKNLLMCVSSPWPLVH